jgi:pilus assembly protein CpaC
MFKPKWISQHIVIAKANKPLQLTALLIGVALLNNSALAARKQANLTTAATVIQEPIGNGKMADCVGQISSPAKLTLPLGKSTLINLPEPLTSRSIGNATVLQAKLISPQTLYLLGLDIGSTNMIIQSKNGVCTIIDVTVGMDPDGLQQTLNTLLPEEKNIKVTAAADALILSGTVEDAITANRAVDLASAYVRRVLIPVPGHTLNLNVSENQNPNNMNQQNNQQNADMVNPRIVNMLSVSAQQQVMLEVKVAEVSKTLLDRLGAEGVIGGNKFKLLTPFFSTPGAIFGLAATGPAEFISSLGTETLIGGSPAVRAQGPTIGRTNGKGISVDAEKRDGLVKILAEPNIMAISGQEGSFLAGGTIFIPVAQNSNGAGTTITLEEKEFGVGVKFTPTVLAGGRINLKVAPEVSELNREGVGITATGISGTAILPSFTTRRASTTVQLMDGQSFAIGGLIKNNTTANIKAFPILGEIPIIGALFRSTDFQKDKTELIFVVTPHLVKPLANKEMVRLPTDRYVDPSRTDIFFGGKLEGKLPPDAPPPVVPDQKLDAIKPNAPAQADDTGFDVR